MGLDVNGVKFLLYARREGVSFTATAMLGRQELQLDKNALASLLTRFGYDLSIDDAGALIADSEGYSEGLLRLLGSDQTTSFDASEYEGGSIAHDFNLPIPDEYRARYSVVLDGGTLEHIFNFPQAVSNCMEMVAEGGHFLGITPTNNHSGHGFYQFSPELFFRIFSQENGFELQHLILFEETLDCPWYEVSDPQAIGERVTILNKSPTMLLVIAKKIGTLQVFERYPQQSDYVTAWSKRQKPRGAYIPPERNALLEVLKRPYRALKTAAQRRSSLINGRPKHFKELDL